MKVLCVDAMNFFHRSASGFQLGDHAVTFNFFRGLRALIEQHEATRVYVVLEGHPKKRYEMFPTYKSNRVVEPGTPKHEEKKKFFKQVDEAVDLMERHIPVSVIRHPDYECDDTVYNLIARSTTAVEWVVASNDSDFTQLLNEFKNVSLYNPMKKEFVEAPDYDYVTWKALRGDGSDCIPGIPGIGDKKAHTLVNDPDALARLFENADVGDLFTRNYELIKFMKWSDEEAMNMWSSSPTRDWDAVKRSFEQWQFQSLLKDKTWDKFVATFDTLFGG